MDAVVEKPMTLEAFLDWERRQELCYEFDGVAPVAMNGGTLIHALLVQNTLKAVEARLPESGFIVFTHGVKIVVDGRVRYPDVVVARAGFELAGDIVPDPVLVVEVLSPSMASSDRVVKNAEYAATPSIQHYVMLEQTRRASTVFSREGGAWNGSIVLENGIIALSALGIDVPLAAIYRDLALSGGDD